MNEKTRDVPEGMIGPDRLQEGVIFDGGEDCQLSKSTISEIVTSSADRITVCTHAGFGYKSVNEDRIALVEQRDDEGLRNGCFVIDGMGGHRDGHRASHVAGRGGGVGG